MVRGKKGILASRTEDEKTGIGKVLPQSERERVEARLWKRMKFPAIQEGKVGQRRAEFPLREKGVVTNKYPFTDFSTEESWAASRPIFNRDGVTGREEVKCGIRGGEEGAQNWVKGLTERKA